MGPRYQWDKERARALLAEGKSDLATAEAVGCSVATLRSWKAREGLTKKRGEPSNTEQINALAKDARSQGLTYGELVARQSLPTVEVPPDVNKVSAPKAPPPIMEEQPVDLHLVLNDEEIYLRAGSTGRALALLSYLSTIIQSEGAAVHVER